MTDAVSDSSIPLDELAPWPQAWFYWNVLEGEVGNGGVMQYFYNQAERLPGFDQAAHRMGAHPVLAPHAHLAHTIHDAWLAVKPRVLEARAADDDFPEQLFASHRERFESLQSAFFDIHRTVSCALEQHMLAHVHDYFDIAPLPGVPQTGVAWVTCDEPQARGQMRFCDGFPVGPNVFEQPNGGACDVVWFTPDRQLMLADRPDWFGNCRNRDWVHYPSGASASLHFDEQGRLSSHETRRALWCRHGLNERYAENGAIESTELEMGGSTLLRQYYHANGQLMLQASLEGDATRERRYWPNGQLNTQSLQSGDDAPEQYLQCLDAAGQDLAPGGTGRFLQCTGDGDYREGTLLDGFLEGSMTWYDATGQGTGRANYKRGREG
jgi:antitoxin component YwqK of YwqJK toxin-antitoxin module